MPTLIVLRHAKAATGFGLPDFDRPLTGRGRRDATAAGKWLREPGLVPGLDGGLAPELVWCSPAKRTRETLQHLAVDAPVHFVPEIYGSDVDSLLELLRETDEQVGTLLLIGHNPAMHQLVHDLTGAGGDTFPTCALAVIEIDGDWEGIRPGIGHRLAYWTPKTPV